MNIRFISILFCSFFLAATSFSSAVEKKVLVEENFGEWHYGYYYGDFKLGYKIRKLSQNSDTVISEKLRFTQVSPPISVQKEEGKFSTRHNNRQAQFDKKTGFLTRQSESSITKFYADDNSLLKDEPFEEEVYTIFTNYLGENTYWITESHKNENKSYSVSLPAFEMFDAFAIRNFILSEPNVGDIIRITSPNFEKGEYVNGLHTVKEKTKPDMTDDSEGYEYVTKLKLKDGSSSRHTYDQYGNLIMAEINGFKTILEPKEQALALSNERMPYEVLNSIGFEKPYRLLKSGHFFKAVAGFEAEASSNPLSFIYFALTVHALNEDKRDEHRPQVKRACDDLITNFSEYTKYWKNDAPLYTSLSICKNFDESLLEKADLVNDPLAMFYKALISKFSSTEAIDLLYEAASFGYCPAMQVIAELYLDENLGSEAYGWHQASKKFGCPAASYASDFKEYSEIDRELVETLADEIFVSIKDNIRELQK